MKEFKESIDKKYIDDSTIDDRLIAFEATLDYIGKNESISWSQNSNRLIVSAALTEAKHDELTALFAADKEAALDDVNNTDKKAKKHREIKAIESCAANVADA
jgi:hypothetical protein